MYFRDIFTKNRVMNYKKTLLNFLIIAQIFSFHAIPFSAQAYYASFFLKVLPKRKKKGMFIPTLNNLNTITMTNFSFEKPKDISCETTISKLANTIYSNYKKIENGTLLPIKLPDHSVKKYCSVFKGIQTDYDDQFITVYSRGFAREPKPLNPHEKSISLYKKILHFLFPGFQMRGLPRKGGGALCAYATIRENLIHTPCISFDYPDTINLLNFAQSLDLECLTTVLNNIPSDKKAIHVGTSRGATALLKQELLNTSDIHPAALVLESPFLCLQDTATQLIKTSIWNLPFPSWLAHTIFQWACPNYNSAEDNLKQLLPTISKDVPIFIVHLKNDPYISDEAMFTMVHTLSQYNDNIHLLVLTDKTRQACHGRLNIIKSYQRAANAFYKEYNLPHDETLAEEGEQLLQQAQVNAYATSLKNWITTECF